MARIPPVRTWRVRYYVNGFGCVCSVDVETINKQFARWMARDKAWPALRDHGGADRITVSLVNSK